MLLQPKFNMKCWNLLGSSIFGWQQASCLPTTFWIHWAFDLAGVELWSNTGCKKSDIRMLMGWWCTCGWLQERLTPCRALIRSKWPLLVSHWTTQLWLFLWASLEETFIFCVYLPVSFAVCPVSCFYGCRQFLLNHFSLDGTFFEVFSSVASIQWNGFDVGVKNL